MKDWQADILNFWFVDTSPSAWFHVNADFDAVIRDRYRAAYDMARQNMFAPWESNADGALALIILLDQFPRNMFRGTPQSFATDAQALQIAKRTIKAGFDQVHPPLRRRFLYLPFEHSENMADQDMCVALFEKMQFDDPLGYEYALRHRHIIQAFGRFPHRNSILGRHSTPAEKVFLGSQHAPF